MTAGMVQTNAYLLTPEAGGEAVLIDAPLGVWAMVAKILEKEKCVLKEVWLTHGHFDHIQGVEEIAAATGVKVFAHEADRAMMEQPEVVEARMGFPLGLKVVKPEGWFTVGEKRMAAVAEAEVRYVPGHCPGSVLFYFAKEGVAFVGDAIFAGSVGRTDFEGGSFPLLEKSIREQIYTLPEATVLYPGHGGTTTVAKEKRGNPYVRP
ncbi:MBL fold metallo-hydrolase [Nibricoccus aquaticus]|nr:MBL fold metallo-hydrolase [Nibricoccus aquaticus]